MHPVINGMCDELVSLLPLITEDPPIFEHPLLNVKAQTALPPIMVHTAVNVMSILQVRSICILPINWILSDWCTLPCYSALVNQAHRGDLALTVRGPMRFHL